LVEKKGVEYLIKAYSEVEKKLNNVFLLIGGAGLRYDPLLKLAKKLKLKNYKFIGKVSLDNQKKFYNSTDLFILPSIIDSKGETETLGVVLLEALACEKPVVASNVGGIADIVTKGCGILVKQKNPDELAKSIIKLINNEAHMKKMGRLGRKRILEAFSSDKQTKLTIEVYNSLR